jgi:ADP-heptose:LPS heptosyltransferase
MTSITHCVDFDYKTGLLALLSGAKKRIGLNIRRHGIFYNQKVPMPSDLHLIHRNYDLVKKAGVKQPLSELPRFYLDSEERISAQRYMEHHHIIPSDFIVGIHPGGGLWRKARRWPKENFIELINRLIQEPGLKILLLGGPDEKSLVDEIFKETHPGVVFSNAPTLGEFGALMEQCNLFLCNDGGLLHIAGAVGTPTIALFGPTDHRVFAPIGKQHLVIRKNLPCSPCIDIYNYQSDACHEITCLKFISVSEVFNIIMDKVNDPDILRRDSVHG